MKIKKSLLMAALVCAGLTAGIANAQVTNYNVNHVPQFGTGNPATGWTIMTDASLNLALGLRGKERLTGATPNDGAGLYTFNPGFAPSTTKATWNYEFIINSDLNNTGTMMLTNYDYYIGINPPAGSPLTVNAYSYNDDAFGFNSTPNGGGVTGTSALASTHTEAGNSESITFAGYNAFQPGVYHLELYATASGAGMDGAHIADVSMDVNVVPEPSSFALLGIGILAFALHARRVRKSVPQVARAGACS